MASANGLGLREKKLTADIRVYAAPELKSLIWDEAEKTGIPLSEYIVRVLAQHIGRPDLAVIPRISVGRPRGKKKKGRPVPA